MKTINGETMHRLNSALSVLIIVGLILGMFILFPNRADAASKRTAQIKIGNKTFSMTLENNKAANEFSKRFPETYSMSRLNGNELYKYVSFDLPQKEKRVKKIHAGDIMLYGSDCIVVFYKSFKTSYSYTRLGHIKNTKGLAKVAKKSRKAKFYKTKSKKVRLNKAVINISEGDTFSLKLMNAKSSKVKWKSSNSSVASVKNGRVKAKNEGSATITAIYNKKKYRCKIKVSGTGTVQLKMRINGKEVNVQWEDKPSVTALAGLVSDKPLEINMSMYGGFEQVGSLGTSIESDDRQITTEPGDIVLYSGSQIVLFYGSNTWAYTKLGRITGLSREEIKELLGTENTVIVIEQT